MHMRPMCVIALGVGAGALLGMRIGGQDCMFLGGCALLLFAISLKMRKRALMLLFLFLALALFRTGVAERGTLPTGTHPLSGTVVNEPTKNKYGGHTVLLKDLTIDGVDHGGRVRAFLKPVVPPVPGQRVTFLADLHALGEYTASYDRYQGVMARAYQADDACVFSAPPAGLTGWLNRVRQLLFDRINRLFPENSELIAAFLIGNDNLITEETHAVFHASGVSHLLAVSGLHVSILATAVFFCLRIPGRWTRFLLMAAFLLCYCVLTFFQPSVVRASIMFLCGALAEPLKRNQDGASALALAFTAIVLANPFVLGFVGFQLSFFAAYGLVTLKPLLHQAFARLGKSAAGTISGTVAATVSTLPSVCRFFGAVPVAGVVVNLLILPLFGAVLVPAFAAVLLSFPFPVPGQWLAMAADHILNMLLAVIDACAGLLLSIPAPGLLSVMLWMGALLFSSKYCMISGKTRLAAVLSLFIGALLVWRI